MSHSQTDERRQAYLDKARAEINELDAQIQVLKAKAENQTADARIRYQDTLEDLRARRDEIGARMAELQDASSDAWDDLRGGFETAMTSMRDSLQAAVDRFR